MQYALKQIYGYRRAVCACTCTAYAVRRASSRSHYFRSCIWRISPRVDRSALFCRQLHWLNYLISSTLARCSANAGVTQAPLTLVRYSLSHTKHTVFLPKSSSRVWRHSAYWGRLDVQTRLPRLDLMTQTSTAVAQQSRPSTVAI